jgi:hypothetical protein
MNKQKAKEQMKALQAEMDALKAIIDEPENQVWIPEMECEYFYTDEAGEMDGACWANDSYDNHRLKTGNVFKTAAEAEYHIKMIDLAWEIRKHSFEPDWSDEYQDKYTLYLNHDSKELYVAVRVSYSFTKTHFPSSEAFDKAFKGVAFEDADYMQRKGLI